MRRNQPVLRDRLFFGVIGVGLVHGAWLILRSTGGEEEVFMPPPTHMPPPRKPAPPTVAAGGDKSDLR
jgi:hypothetical protein